MSRGFLGYNEGQSYPLKPFLGSQVETVSGGAQTCHSEWRLGQRWQTATAERGLSGWVREDNVAHSVGKMQLPTAELFMLINPEIGLKVRKPPNKTCLVHRLGSAESTATKSQTLTFLSLEAAQS